MFVVLGVLVLIPVVAFVTLAVSARNSDGPSTVFSGGPLVAGELVTGPEPDWSFARDIGTIELQLLEPPRSRLIWVIEYEGKVYVVSGYMGSRIGRLWKRWAPRHRGPPFPRLTDDPADRDRFQSLLAQQLVQAREILIDDELKPGHLLL